MDNSTFWWQAAGVDPGPGPGPDAGDPIGQSLRFRGAQYLAASKSIPSGNFTFSLWFKRAEFLGSNMAIATWDNVVGLYLKNTTDKLYTVQGGTLGELSDGAMRDQSAWYHCVFVNNSGTISLYINGVKQSQTQNKPSGSGNIALGSSSASYVDDAFCGHMAAVYLVEQVLEPTTFGRFNSQGVWVPVDPDGLTYGTNGFKLTFEDPSNIGKDYSGNGNDFTAAGFDLAPPGIWSTQYTASTSFTGSNPAALAFDGNTGTLSAITSSGTGTFAPSTPIEVKSKLELVTFSGTNQIVWEWVNDSGVNVGPGNDNIQAPTPWQIGTTGTISASNPLVLRANPATTSASVNLAAVIVDGTILVDSTGTDYDHMADSPTQNWSTLNPLGFNNGAKANPQSINANLGFTVSSNSDIGFTIFEIPKTGKYYFELNPAASNLETAIRLYAPKETNTSANGGGAVADVMSQGQGGLERWIAIQGSLTPNGQIPKPNPVGNMQVVIDADTSKIYLGDGQPNQWFKNNSGSYSIGAFDLNQPTIDYSGLDNPQLAVYGSDNTAINFGQQPFQNTPPAGFEALQTQNMPTPEILDGRDHFQAITGPGSGGFLVYPEGTSGTLDGKTTEPLDTSGPSEYSPVSSGYGRQSYVLDAFIETLSITFSITAGWGIPSTTQLYTSADGINWTRESDIAGLPDGPQTYNATNPSRYWRFYWPTLTRNFGKFTSTNAPILELAKTTFPNGLWWIKDRANSNQHQLVDSVRGGNLALQCPASGAETAYVAPAGSSVAWCWKAGGAAVTNNDGTITSQVSANTEAGFSIVTYTGNDTAGSTIGHGLNSEPELIIVKNYGEASPRNWAVYSRYADVNNPGNYVAYLNAGDGWVSNSSYWSNTQAAADVFTVGDSSQTNAVNTHVAYCWHSVPNYSSFGSYTGNGNDDGPFIYTGHSVAWLLIKQSDSTQYWGVYDATRSPNNPTDFALYPNTTQEEFSDAKFDFLSNGFKIRDSSSFINKSGSKYIYAAFASCPFQSPATAR